MNFRYIITLLKAKDFSILKSFYYRYSIANTAAYLLKQQVYLRVFIRKGNMFLGCVYTLEKYTSIYIRSTYAIKEISKKHYPVPVHRIHSLSCINFCYSFHLTVNCLQLTLHLVCYFILFFKLDISCETYTFKSFSNMFSTKEFLLFLIVNCSCFRIILFNVMPAFIRLYNINKNKLHRFLYTDFRYALI